MKTLILLLTLVSSIFALTLNESLLKVHSTLVPKIYLMDYKFEDKLQNNTITIAIIYKNNEYKDAKLLQNMIENRYHNGIKSYNVEAKLVKYKNIQTAQANIYYLFPAKEEEIKKVIQQASTNNALTFSYLRDDLKYGVMISLHVSKKIKPLLNLEAIKTHHISLRPVLIKISTIYSYDLDSSIQQLDSRSFNFFRVYQV